MKLSVVIVNYNVEAYLEQCLRSVTKALEKIDGEIFVVDNQSTDGSVEMVRRRFPNVNLIANRINVGFSRANNQAIDESKGEYVVLLNPDTVVGEDVFMKVVDFMDAHPDSGGLGVKMIDGSGNFLPESKRGLPTPSVAFFKIIGLTRLFPKSRIFGRYHLGHLHEDETTTIEILSGACMFLRRKTLDQVGVLDESFFMYGEDIDLSYRILLGGWKNYYYPKAKIIHYKGESTKKSSVNYVRVFYNAMALFARKLFASTGADIMGSLINIAIFLSAVLAIAARFLLKMALPIMDVFFSTALFLLFRENFDANQVAPMIAAMLFISALSGIYDLPVRVKDVLRALAISILLTSLARIFGLVEWHGFLWATGITVAATLIGRLVMHFSGSRGFDLKATHKHRVLTIGSEEEAQKVKALLWQTHYGLGNHEHLEMNGTSATELAQLIASGHFDEVIFCAADIPSARIINLLNEAGTDRITFKIASPGVEYIIGANSIESMRDLFLLQDQGIKGAPAQRTKRILDFSLSILLLLSLPISIWFIKERGNLYRNIRNVISGARTWIGFPVSNSNSRIQFPRPGILLPAFLTELNTADTVRGELVYAKDYSYIEDLRSFIKGFPHLGR